MKNLASQRTHAGKRLLVFDTHPIQYRSPVFRSLYRSHPELKVYFFADRFDGNRWWFHEVGKIPPQNFALPLTEGFPNEILGLDALGPAGKFARIREVLRRERPQAVVTYGYYLPEHWILRLLTARLGVPLVFIGETFTLGGSAARRLLKKPLIRFFFRGVSQFVAIGYRTAAHYRSLGIPGDRITPARYCTDTGFFSLPPDRSRSLRLRWREERGIAPDDFVLLFVGRLFDRKRPEDLIRLHGLLKDRGDVHTVIVGNGPLEEALRERGKELARLRFEGFRNQEELRAFYHGADLLVVPSAYETWGLVVNEAFAAGTPALVTDTCGVAGDLVIPGETGLVFPVGMVEEAARLVRTLLDDPSRLAALREAARRKVSEEYTVDQFAEALLAAAGRLW